MLVLPHRFVPTTSKLVSPVRIVAQYGHANALTAVAVSPCQRLIASTDADKWLYIWSFETLEVLGIYDLSFLCDHISWNDSHSVLCSGNGLERTFNFNDDDFLDNDQASPLPDVSNNVIRLLDAPEASRNGDTLIITSGSQAFEHVIPQLLAFTLDPCERYVITISPNAVQVFSAFEDKCLMTLDAPKPNQWCGMHLNWRGDFATILLNNGQIWNCDPVHLKAECIHKDNTTVTAFDFSRDNHLVYGNPNGVLTIFDIPSHAVLFRTPRKPIAFNAVFPTPEKVGFMALRPESATAFFSHSKEILSASPLPAKLLCACPGTLFSELLCACTDNVIYRLKLDDNSIAKVCTTSKQPVMMTASGAALFIIYKDGSADFFDGKSLSTVDWKAPSPPTAIALSDNTKTFAAAWNNHVEIIDRTNKSSPRSITVNAPQQLAFGREKSANSILVFTRDASVHAFDIRSGERTLSQSLCIPTGRILSVAPAAKSFIHILAENEHGQYAILKIGLNTGKSSLALRVFSSGTQIWGAALTEDAVSIRNDAPPLRIISGLKAFSIDDWSRSEPLSIF